MLKFYVKVFHVMGKALLGELSCTRTSLVVYCKKGKENSSVRNLEWLIMFLKPTKQLR